MTKLEAILKGCKLADKLTGLREKEVRRKLDAAKDECEEKKIKAQLAYELALKKLGEDNVDYKRVLNDMIQAKDDIREAEQTLTAIKEIEADLNSEAELKPEDEKE